MNGCVKKVENFLLSEKAYNCHNRDGFTSCETLDDAIMKMEHLLDLRNRKQTIYEDHVEYVLGEIAIDCRTFEFIQFFDWLVEVVTENKTPMPQKITIFGDNVIGELSYLIYAKQSYQKIDEYKEKIKSEQYYC